MNINPIRAVILVVVAVAGVLVIANGFTGPTSVAAETSPAVTTTTTPTTPTTNQSPGSQDSGQGGSTNQKPDMTGVVFQVFNATTTSGLAKIWQDKLQTKIQAQPATDPIGNASPDQDTTTVFYVDKADRGVAEELQKKYFPDGDAAYQGKDGADLPDLTDATGTAPATISKDTQLIVVLGTDAAS